VARLSSENSQLAYSQVLCLFRHLCSRSFLVRLRIILVRGSQFLANYGATKDHHHWSWRLWNSHGAHSEVQTWLHRLRGGLITMKLGPETWTGPRANVVANDGSRSTKDERVWVGLGEQTHTLDGESQAATTANTSGANSFDQILTSRSGSDVAIHLYSFSFNLNPDWSEELCAGDEIKQCELLRLGALVTSQPHCTEALTTHSQISKKQSTSSGCDHSSTSTPAVWAPDG
jgi:hypothetical protein